VVPMCFQGVLAWMNDSEVDGETANPLFASAPQRALYPTITAEPIATVSNFQVLRIP
jgi:hypothetical protein